MTQPRCLDLFCGAGGATRGYQRVGYHVTGVDLEPQPHYCGDAFVRGDAIGYLAEHAHEFDVIHASPPCQNYSSMAVVTGRRYVDLIPITQLMLRELELPYVIENVPRAPIRRDLLLCGTQFGLEVIRHRAFELGFKHGAIMTPPHSCHNATITGAAIAFRDGGRVRGGRTKPPRTGGGIYRDAMECTWMTVKEGRQAIPPAYTEFIGTHLLAVLGRG